MKDLIGVATPRANANPAARKWAVVAEAFRLAVSPAVWNESAALQSAHVLKPEGSRESQFLYK